MKENIELQTECGEFEKEVKRYQSEASNSKKRHKQLLISVAELRKSHQTYASDLKKQNHTLHEKTKEIFRTFRGEIKTIKEYAIESFKLLNEKLIKDISNLKLQLKERGAFEKD